MLLLTLKCAGTGQRLGWTDAWTVRTIEIVNDAEHCLDLARFLAGAGMVYLRLAINLDQSWEYDAHGQPPWLPANAVKQRQCSQKTDAGNCPERAVVAFTWPGKSRQLSCQEHALHARRVAQSIGFDLELIPAFDEEPG